LSEINTAASVPWSKFDAGKSIPPMEEPMNREQLQENKARWTLFEQVSTTSSAFIWAAAAVVVVIAAYYLLV